jgi:hypothetical protein
VHLLGAMGWIGVLVGSLALMLGLATWPVDAAATTSLNRLIHAVSWGFLLPCGAATIISGYLLARPYRAHCPRWLAAKVYLTTAVAVLGGVILINEPRVTAYLAPARTAGLLALVAVVVLSVTRPNGRRPVRGTTIATTITPEPGGRHRK